VSGGIITRRVKVPSDWGTAGGQIRQRGTWSRKWRACRLRESICRYPLLFFCRRRTQTDTDRYLKAEYGVHAENMP